MLISELPQPYKALAEKRREEAKFCINQDSLEDAFAWFNTPEQKIDNVFWFHCHLAQTESELPPYPYE